VLFIPGSATTVGGQGVLLKTAGETYDEALLRDPGSLKVAQADNPKRWGYGMNRIMLNWQIRETLRRGKAHVRLERERAAAAGEEPSYDPQWEIFAALVDREAQISTHTQVAQVVAASVRIMALEAGLPMFIDHGSMDGYRVAGMARDAGVQAILGPRNFSSQNLGRDIDHDGKIVGFAAEYQKAGHPAIGFNTDAPVIPAEELSLQAGIASRFGFLDDELQTIRGLTRVPAETVGMGGRIGSLRPGLDADIVVITGHPGDPRSSVEAVYVDGRLRYDTASDWRVF
jgi:imidazolonepropionase-like amidohydrolase